MKTRVATPQWTALVPPTVSPMMMPNAAPSSVTPTLQPRCYTHPSPVTCDLLQDLNTVECGCGGLRDLYVKKARGIIINQAKKSPREALYTRNIIGELSQQPVTMSAVWV